jgi:hypothetical protein
MTNRITLIFIEALLIITTIALIVANWLPIDRFRHWLAGVF